MMNPNIFVVILLLPLTSVVVGQSCWRDTTCSGPTEASFSGTWDSYVYAPSSRTVSPHSVLSLSDASVISNYSGSVSLTGNLSALVFDFGLEVGGIIHLNYTVPSNNVSLGLAFSEAKTWIGLNSDSANRAGSTEGAIYTNVSESGNYSYVMEDKLLRGGFRYLTLFLVTLEDDDATVEVNSIELEIAFAPTWSNLRAYTGYFYSNDDLLNRIWYAGAYTLQTNAIPANTGRFSVTTEWANNATVGPGDTVLVDGAKRDRAVWPGDMGVAAPASFVSIGDLESIRNALQVMYDYQGTDGSFPMSGPPMLVSDSDTYHMWNMIGTYNYYLYSGNSTFLEDLWGKYLLAMEYIYAKVDISGSGLLTATNPDDWGRTERGGNNTAANALLYRTLTTGAALADWRSNTTNSTQATTWLSAAADLKAAINTHCFSTTAGLYTNNATSGNDLYPQDANSMAILFGVADDAERAANVSSGLTRSWTSIGAAAPELPDTVSPFVSSLEIQAHCVAGNASRALDLVRRSWGWYADHPNGTQSTVIEGYKVDGSFGYRSEGLYKNDPSYVSHAHGWGAGPTTVLTEFVVGLRVADVQGKRWRIRPLYGDLERAEGGFTTGLGKFRAAWVRDDDGGVELTFGVPAETEGVVVLSVDGDAVVTVKTADGEEPGEEEVQVSQSSTEVEIAVNASGAEYTVTVSYE